MKVETLPRQPNLVNAVLRERVPSGAGRKAANALARDIRLGRGPAGWGTAEEAGRPEYGTCARCHLPRARLFVFHWQTRRADAPAIRYLHHTPGAYCVGCVVAHAGGRVDVRDAHSQGGSK